MPLPPLQLRSKTKLNERGGQKSCETTMSMTHNTDGTILALCWKIVKHDQPVWTKLGVLLGVDVAVAACLARAGTKAYNVVSVVASRQGLFA